MLRTNDSKSGTKSYTLGNFRTILLISHVYKTLCFSFEAFRTAQLIQQIATNLNCGYLRELTFSGYTLYVNVYIANKLIIMEFKVAPYGFNEML